MAGTGKSNKKLYINIGEQAVDFETEATSYYALSGNMKGMPAFSPGFEEIKIPSHAEYGENRTVKKGKAKHTIEMPFVDIVNFRYLAHIFGGRLDQSHILETASGNATEFVDNELITGGTSGAKARIDDVGVKAASAVDVPLLKFSVGDSITGVTSSAIGTIVSIKGTVMVIKVVSGTFTVGGEEIQTTTSPTTTAYTVASAIATSGSIATATIILFANSEIVTGAGGGTGTIGSDGIITQHDLFVQASVDPKSIVYVHEALDTIAQHLMIGSVADNAEIKGVAGTAPLTGKIMYKVANYDKDTTIGAEQSIDNDDDIYEYTAVDFTIDSVTYEDIARAFTAGFSRGHADLDTFAGLNQKGFNTGPFASSLSFEIHKNDFVITDLMLGTSTFPVVITLRRGTANEDECILTYTCSLMSEGIGEGQNTILSTITPVVHSVPTVVVRDKNQNYN